MDESKPIEDTTPMEDTKPWYQSKTIIGAAAAAVAALAGLINVELEGSEATTLVTGLFSIIGAIMAVWGRKKATKQVK